MRLARIILAFSLLIATFTIILTTKPRAAMEHEEIVNRLALGLPLTTGDLRHGQRPARRGPGGKARRPAGNR